VHTSNTSATSSQMSCRCYFLPCGVTFRKLRAHLLVLYEHNVAMAARTTRSHENWYELFHIKIS